MSWVNGRKTNRSEDRVYSLLGLFNVNMTMLYGEGLENAFYRLQENILQNTEDQSIFAWQGVTSDYFGPFARSSDQFLPLPGHVCTCKTIKLRTAHSKTSQGILLEFDMLPHTEPFTFEAVLNGPIMQTDSGQQRSSILLRQLDSTCTGSARTTITKSEDCSSFNTMISDDLGLQDSRTVALSSNLPQSINLVSKSYGGEVYRYSHNKDDYQLRWDPPRIAGTLGLESCYVATAREPGHSPYMHLSKQQEFCRIKGISPISKVVFGLNSLHMPTLCFMFDLEAHSIKAPDLLSFPSNLLNEGVLTDFWRPSRNSGGYVLGLEAILSMRTGCDLQREDYEAREGHVEYTLKPYAAWTGNKACITPLPRCADDITHQLEVTLSRVDSENTKVGKLGPWTLSMLLQTHSEPPSVPLWLYRWVIVWYMICSLFPRIQVPRLGYRWFHLSLSIGHD